MYKRTRMDDQDDDCSLPSWLKDDKHVMGGTAETAPLNAGFPPTTQLLKTGSYGGQSSSVRSGASSDHANIHNVEEDYGHDDSVAVMDLSWAVDPESPVQDHQDEHDNNNNNKKKNDYGSVMELEQGKKSVQEYNSQWEHDNNDEEDAEEEEEESDDGEDSSSRGSSGSGSSSEDDESDGSNESQNDNDDDGYADEETNLISRSNNNKKKTTVMDKTNRNSNSNQKKKQQQQQRQQSKPPNNKKWYQESTKSYSKKKKKGSQGKRREGGKRMIPPRRNCCHSFFIMVQIAAILANLCMIAIEVVPVVYVLKRNKPETLQILDIVLRCYFTFFSTSFLVTELEWIDSSLNNWITRGFLYTFLGVVAREQHLAMLANGTLVVKENSKEYWNGVWASLFVEISSWWIIGIGILYFLLGIFCMKAMRNRFREQYQSRLRDFYEEQRQNSL